MSEHNCFSVFGLSPEHLGSIKCSESEMLGHRYYMIFRRVCVAEVKI